MRDRPVYHLPPGGLAKLRDVFDGAKDGLRETFYRWDDRLVREHISLPEDYISNRVAVVCQFVSSVDRGSGGVFLAAIGRGDNDAVVIRELDSFTRKQVGYREAADGEHTQGRGERNMLVADVKVVNSEERIVPSTVWLYSVANEVSDVLADGLYWSVIQGRYKTIPVPVKRETRIVGWPPSEVTYEFVVHQVEGRPEVVKYVADDRRQVHGEAAVPDAEDLSPVLVIQLNERTPRVTIEQGVDSPLELRDVLIGPFDL